MFFFQSNSKSSSPLYDDPTVKNVYIPSIDCIQQKKQQYCSRIVTAPHANQRIITEKYVGVGNYASFSISSSMSGIASQLVKYPRPSIMDISLNYSQAGILCEGSTQTNLIKAAKNIINVSGALLDQQRVESSDGQMKISDDIKYDYIEGNESYKIRFYNTFPRGGITKYALSANNRNYTLSIQILTY